MENMLQKISEAAAFLKSKGFDNAKTGIVLGTGLGVFIHNVTVERSISYSEIPHFPISTVEFHKGQLVLANAGGTRVIAMQGAFSFL